MTVGERLILAEPGEEFMIGAKSNFLAGGTPDECRRLLRQEQKERYNKHIRQGGERSFEDFDFLERDIKEEYANVIICEGDEQGKYWTLNEIRHIKPKPVVVDEKAAWNLRNYIIVRAFEDWKMVLKYEYGKEHHCHVKGQIDSGGYKMLKESCERFLFGEDIKYYTDVDINKIAREYREWLWNEVFPMIPRLVYYHKKHDRYRIYQACSGRIIVTDTEMDAIYRMTYNPRKLTKEELKILLKEFMNENSTDRQSDHAGESAQDGCRPGPVYPGGFLDSPSWGEIHGSHRSENKASRGDLWGYSIQKRSDERLWNHRNWYRG